MLAVGRLADILKPISVITDESASDRLLSASATIATDALIKPAPSLIIKKNHIQRNPDTAAKHACSSDARIRSPCRQGFYK